MKKIFYYICTATLTFGLSSCVKDLTATEDRASFETGQMTITATIGEDDSTKSTFNGDDQTGYKILWSAGDQIKIYNPANSQYYTYTLAKGAGTRVGTFTGDQIPAGTYTATCGTGFSYTPSSCTFDAAQNAYTFDSASWVPMTASITVSSEGNATATNFKNATGFVRLNIEGKGTVKQIKITADQYISGAATLSNGALAIKQSGSGIYKDVTFTCGQNGIDFYDEQKTVYFALPKGEYTGLKVELIDPYGFAIPKTLKAEKTFKIERAKITSVALPVFSFISGESTKKDGEKVGWVQLWAGGPRFAAYNVGVTDGKPESYGGHYCFGGHTDMGDKDYYTGSGNLSGDNDTATYLWGSNWRMPTEAELRALLGNCDKTWTSVNGVNGEKFTGKGDYASNSIFLPATGRYGYGQIRNVGSAGTCWASTLDPGYIYYLVFQNNGYMTVYGINKNERYELSSVRAVLAE